MRNLCVHQQASFFRKALNPHAYQSVCNASMRTQAATATFGIPKPHHRTLCPRWKFCSDLRIVSMESDGDTATGSSASVSRQSSCNDMDLDNRQPEEIREGMFSTAPPAAEKVGDLFKVEKVNLTSTSSSLPPSCTPPMDTRIAARRDMPCKWSDFFPTGPHEVFNWHPNRTCAALVQYLATKVGEKRVRKRLTRTNTKAFDPVTTLIAWTSRPGMVPFQCGVREARSALGRNFFRKIVTVISGNTSRTCETKTMPIWKRLSQEDRMQWYCMRRICMHEDMRPYLPELKDKNCLDEPVPFGQKHHVESAEKESETIPSGEGGRKWGGYGFVVTYNTKLGQDDPAVIKVVQSGLKGAELRKQLKQIPVYHEAFEDLWVLTNTLANRLHFDTVNVTLEHSEHGDHPARVHFHTFIGLDLSKGNSFAVVPSLRFVPTRDFQWRDCFTHISPTITARKGFTAVYQAVATGAYYVAGPKSTLIMKRSTLEPILDSFWKERKKLLQRMTRNNATCEFDSLLYMCKKLFSCSLIELP